jgi:hypothetical protein
MSYGKSTSVGLFQNLAERFHISPFDCAWRQNVRLWMYREPYPASRGDFNYLIP